MTGIARDNRMQVRRCLLVFAAACLAACSGGGGSGGGSNGGGTTSPPPPTTPPTGNVLPGPRPVVEVQYLSAVAEVRPEDFVTQLRLARAAHRAHRQSRAAGAFARAATAFASQGAGEDPEVEAIRVRAARAEELAGNLELGPETSHFRAEERTVGTKLKRMGRRLSSAVRGQPAPAPDPLSGPAPASEVHEA